MRIVVAWARVGIKMASSLEAAGIEGQLPSLSAHTLNLLVIVHELDRTIALGYVRAAGMGPPTESCRNFGNLLIEGVCRLNRQYMPATRRQLPFESSVFRNHFAGNGP
jgi:hypothetical protein